LILVIGATGTVGRELVKQLSERDIEVRAFSRCPDRADFPEGARIEIAKGDLGIPHTIEAALEGVDKAFLASSADPAQVELQGNFVRAAQKTGIRHIVKLSTLSASPKATFAQGRWHRETEIEIEDSGIPFTFLRPHNFMQNTLNFAPSIVSDGVLRAPLGDARISMINARDVAAVAAAALTEGGHEGRIYRLTGPEALSFYQIAEKISAVIGRKVAYVSVNLEEAHREMLEAGMSKWQADDLIGLYRQFQAGKGARLWDDVLRVTKKKPISFEQFVLDYAHIFKGDQAAKRRELL